MTAGDVFVVDSTERAAELLATLQAVPGPFGVDCETVGCNPKKQSPVHTARIVCFTVAWKEGALTRSAFIWAEFLPLFKAWLEDASVHKIGARFPGYDIHCFENEGVLIRGFVHDNVATSRLWYSSKEVAHDLKSQAESVLGYRTRSFSSVFARAKQNKPKVYKTTKFYKAGNSRTGPLAGVPTLIGEGEVSQISYAGKLPIVPLDEVRTKYTAYLPDLISYAAEDAVWSLELAPKREKQLASRPAKFGTTLQLYNDVWNPLLLMLNRMERKGIAIDRAVAGRVQAEAQADMNALLPGIAEFADSPDFNPGSSDQLRELLFEKLGLRRPAVKGTLFAISRTEDTEWSTSEASLHWLQIKHPEYNEQLDLIRRWRKARRQMQTGRDLPGFVSPLDGRVHCVLGPDTDTGRLSCKLPALQQVSSKNDKYGIRGAFVAAPGKRLVVADFSQLEVYVLAHMLIRLFGDCSLRDALASGDVYSWIARAAWPHDPKWTDAEYQTKGHPAKKRRDMAKILVLATNYGKTPMGLAITLLDETGEPANEQYCADLLSTYMDVLPGVAMWQEWIAKYARDHRGVPTLLGRWRPLVLAGTRRGDRQALNSPIQGGASDIATLVALQLNTYDWVPHWFHPELAALGACLLLQVHDELIYEVPEENAEAALAIVKHGMEHPPMLDLAVQLRVEAAHGDSWKAAK